MKTTHTIESVKELIEVIEHHNAPRSSSDVQKQSHLDDVKIPDGAHFATISECEMQHVKLFASGNVSFCLPMADFLEQTAELLKLSGFRP